MSFYQTQFLQNLFQLCMERRTVCAIGAPLAAVLISKLVFDWYVTLTSLPSNTFLDRQTDRRTFWLFIVDYKGAVAFGHSGDEIVVRRHIPWGHYTAGAKNFRALVYMWSKPPWSFITHSAVLLEIFVFFWWSIFG